LMERAGAAVVHLIRGRWSRCPVWVLCGPGKNRGDGWVIARLLREAGWPVEAYSDGRLIGLVGDMQIAAKRCAWSPRRLTEATASISLRLRWC
ncbi:MAG: NAD(P)H-hydrate epimerase, partial [Pseudomonadota bacterium]